MSLPRVTRQWLVQKLSQNFRESVALQEVPLAEPTGREMIIKNHAVGINASDVNFTSGAYMPGVKPPFPCGFEAVGTVVAAGPKAMAKEGDTVCYMEYGAFADYQTTSKVFPVPSADPKYIPLLVSGLTAAISLNENGVDVFKKDASKKPPRVGLVTAAAGGTGQFATQLLAHAGAKKVIATCSSQEKADFLKSIGATDVINLSEEKLGVALPELAPSGVNVAYESVGGKVLDSVVDNLATAGKCVQIGFISSYLEKGGMARGVSPQGKRSSRLRTRPPRRNSSTLTSQNYKIIPAKQYPQISSKGRMEWEVCPDSVLVIRKLHYDTVGPFVELADWLLKEKNMFVFVEEKTLTDDDISSSEHSEKFEEIKSELKVFQGMTGFEKISEKIDFVVCLGGDGTLLYASSLFPSCIPPVMSFNLGSLGFLTPFDFTEFKEHIEDVIQGNMKVLLRSRLHAELITPGSDSPDVSNTALNEIVVDRGSHHYLSNLELYVNDNLVTQVQADGIIIATPTGSTAYSLSAGAGMVHPAVPAILITPICPHSLSFRPIVVPSTSVIKIKVVPEARKHAVVSFDGRLGPELQKSQDLIIKASEHSLPTVSRMDHDWFNTLQDLLAWNTRVKQKALTNNNKPPTKL